MCGCFVQLEGVTVFVEELSAQLPPFSGFDDLPINRYKVAPSTGVSILRDTEDGVRRDKSVNESRFFYPRYDPW